MALVSAIMPTADRRRYIPDAIRRFLAQDYPDKELIIVDDGDDPVGDLVLKDPQIRYVFDKPRRLLGDKRNFCCQLAHGEVIAHWDDDDYYASWRLTRQVNELRKGFDICGLADPLLFHQEENRAYQLQFPWQKTKPWLYGATFCYRKDLWDGHRFDSTRHRAEDDQFVNSLQWEQVSMMQQEWGMFIALKHTTNTGMGFELGGTYWRPFPPEIIRRLMREDNFRPRNGEIYQRWLPPGLG